MISLIALRRAQSQYPAPFYYFPHGSPMSGGIPINTVLPVISGAVQVGQTVTVTNGSWTNSPTLYTYQWNNEGSPLTGSGNPTTSAYTLQTTDIGCLITCTVVANNGSGNSLPALTALAGPTLGTTVFYVSRSSGSDSYDGTAPAFVSGTTGPWATLNKVNAQSFSAGTSVLFKRGDRWRQDGCSSSLGTQLSPSSSGSTGNPIVFDAYGTGANPVLDGSYGLSSVGDWQATVTPNVWQSVVQFSPVSANGHPNNQANDVGNLIWGGTPVGGVTPAALINASYGVMTGGGLNGIWYNPGDGAAHLTAAGQWNFNTDNFRVQVFSVGNPATTGMRAAIDTCLIYFNAQSNLTFQNFTLTYCAASAIDTGGAGGTCTNITLRDCVVQWIGGGNISGDSDSHSRYGDGWDIEGGCDGMLMERVWWHQIYDSGPGPQCGSIQNNITIRNNVCTSCGVFFSTFFLGGTPSSCTGLTIENNTVDCTANAWSNNPTQRPDNPGPGFKENVIALILDTVSTSTVQSNLSVKNNIFAGISGVSPTPGFGIDGTGWSVGGGVNPSNPYTSSGAWLNYNCWPQNPLSPTGPPAQDIALTSGNYRMVDWVQGTNIGGAGTFTPALEINGIFSQDPLFTSQATFDFSLQTGSPCRTSGVNLYSQGVVWDFNHNPRPVSGSFAMGAFQVPVVVNVPPILIANLNMSIGTLPLAA